MIKMERCLKVLNLLIEKKVAEVEGDKLRLWEYEGIIKHHIEKCPSCRKFLEGMYERNKLSDVDCLKAQLAQHPGPVRFVRMMRNQSLV